MHRECKSYDITPRRLPKQPSKKQNPMAERNFCSSDFVINYLFYSFVTLYIVYPASLEIFIKASNFLSVTFSEEKF